jgi:HAD superfamily hydrolase (TIGR01450 family)
MKLRDFDNYIFDMDGTFWWWTQIIPGAAETVRQLKKQGKEIYFITNNCVLTRVGFVKKLRGFGVETDTDHIINPFLVAAKLFKGKRVLVIGEGIKSELSRVGARVVKKGGDAVLVSEDRHTTYEKLALATEAVWKGAKGYKTAMGGVWFIDRKNRVPGAGAIAAALEEATRREFELIGKPSAHLARIIRAYKFKPEKTLMIGDELGSDVALGKRLGFATALVLTGRDTLNDCRNAKKEDRPDFVLKSMAAIIK